ncbi:MULTISPECIES: phospholipase effector Tle1 domain-containing protein [Acinetobacter]|uniref:DUF2235 domain-containing protein n=1 Tax=Acinetobacter piscicola TaxID=2006115 RepID=A0A7S6VY86_9GAMM|nr:MULTISPECIES: DUF2235 domain-containing protein [Acinetobacter]QOW47010.1 DUF2235 domain-containing protein [Acinetobacter piscicola]
MAEIQKKPGEQALTIGNTTPPGNTHVDANLDIFTVHVFFDGTGNNRFNTASHRTNPRSSPDGSVSYENYYSNIALLFMAMRETDTVKKLYAEGSGTTQGQSDDSRGLGLAMGGSGRWTRVSELLHRLNNLVGSRNKANVVINVYGFSRGAAWARYFCHLLRSTLGGAWVDQKHEEWKKAKINFVGIFDTVSSDGTRHYNDVRELGLDIGKPEGINYIAHLTAQNDYREHFPLTRIRGAIRDGIGFECSFPGAHSDIGGGYSEIYLETNKALGRQDRAAQYQGAEYIDYQWFVNKGYYKTEQITKKMEMSGRDNFIPKLYANRKTYFHYQFIVGNIMYELANRRASYQKISSSSLERGVNDMKKIDLLNRFYSGALAYVLQNYQKKGGGYHVPILNNPEEMKTIYNLFIHNSLGYGTIANGGTILSKTRNADQSYNYSNPIRPQVTEGFR